MVVHRIGRSSQGPIDTIRSDTRGRFRVALVPDTAALYLLSVRYQGIEYFSAPVRADPRRPDTALALLVADTSSTAPVGLAERTLLIGRPDASGSRTVLDWLVLVNRGERTRVAPDALRPSWGSALPEAARDVGLAELPLGQFSPDAVTFRGDSVLVFAPISPGRKELILQYRIPGRLRRFVAPTPAADSVFVLLEDPDARVDRPPLVRGGGQSLEGRTFSRWSGGLGSESSLTISFPAPGPSPGLLLAGLLALAGLGFLALGLRRLRPRAGWAEGPNPVALADAIARLDLEVEEAGPALSEAARLRYGEERARLQALLARALAASRRRS